jgi:hypothetical protein
MLECYDRRYPRQTKQFGVRLMGVEALSLMNLRAWIRTVAWSVMATAAFAQSPSGVPESDVPELGQALRQRVTQFFNYHVGKIDRRALDLVAEDTKDYYYTTQKSQFEDFRIDRLEFNKELDHATVWGHGHRNLSIQGQSINMDSEVITTWKLEDGNWAWYLDQNGLLVTPMSDPNSPARSTAASATAALPTGALSADLVKPENLLAQSQTILQQSGVDKDEITLTVGKAGSGVFTFQNGYPGDVMLELTTGDYGIPGLNVRLETPVLKAHQNGKILVDYNPPADGPKQQQSDLTLNLWLQPFNRIFPLKVIFNNPPPR